MTDQTAPKPNITEVRGIARQLYLDCNGDARACMSNARDYVEQHYGSILVIIAVVGLILQFIQFWYSQGVKDPGPFPLAGEPDGE